MRNERPPPLPPAPPAGTNAKAGTAAAAVPSLLAAVAAVSVGAHAIIQLLCGGAGAGLRCNTRLA
ncbi:MAG: hypothetical protein ACKPKO_24320, partial [Candidatus Fonsibacter sp.]